MLYRLHISSFFGNYVIGFLERLLPAPYAQRICQGLVNQEQEIKRNFKLEFFPQIKPYPLNPDYSFSKGFFLDCYTGILAGDIDTYLELAPRVSELEKLCKKISIGLSNLMSPSHQSECLVSASPSF